MLPTYHLSRALFQPCIPLQIATRISQRPTTLLGMLHQGPCPNKEEITEIWGLMASLHGWKMSSQTSYSSTVTCPEQEPKQKKQEQHFSSVVTNHSSTVTYPEQEPKTRTTWRISTSLKNPKISTLTKCQSESSSRCTRARRVDLWQNKSQWSSKKV